jgi:DnaJ-class molecular chaperone
MDLRNLRISPAQAEQGGVMTVAVSWERCSQCRGRGYSVGSADEKVGLCSKCKGAGRVSTNRTIELELPPGLQHGAKLSVRGEGSLRWDGKRDDLVYVVEVNRGWEALQSDQGEGS